jgi:nucleotide-binding universal stress UspA family protein
MSKSILCAVDLGNSNQDANVLAQAAKLAQLDGAQLDVVTVVPDFGDAWVSTFFESHYHEKLEGEVRGKLEALCLEVLGAERNASVRHIVATGTAYREILHTADKAGTDLIVIGAHQPDLKDYLLGPNAARVIRHSTCSVFVVRD